MRYLTYNAPLGDDVPVRVISEPHLGNVTVRVTETVAGYRQGQEFDCPLTRLTVRKRKPGEE